MSIENSITKIAEAISALAQSGNAIAVSINRYCDMAHPKAVSKDSDTALKADIAKAVAKFDAEHAEHVEHVEHEAQSTPPEVAKVEAPVVSETPPPKVKVVKVESPVEAQSNTDVSFEEAKTAVIDAVSSKGKPAVAAIFKQLGAKNLPGLDPSQYAELVALCTADDTDGIPF